MILINREDKKNALKAEFDHEVKMIEDLEKCDINAFFYFYYPEKK